MGLWSDGETLWVAGLRERVYAYRLSDGRRDPANDVHAGVGDTDPSGLWSGGGTLLSTSWEAAEVRAYRLPELPARNSGIRALAGLERAVGLKQLDLGFNALSDLHPLAGLSRLKTLRLGSNRLAELYPLSGLEGLSELDLTANAVEDLSALASLDALRRLDLRGTAVGDLRPLRALPSLVWVHVGGSRLEDLAPLDGISGLAVAGRDDPQPPEAVGGGAGQASRD